MNTPPPIPHTEMPSSGKSHDSRLAICSLILGIIGFCTGGIVSIPAIITGHLARRKIKRSAEKLTGSGFALAGIISGYLGLVLMPIFLIGAHAIGNTAIDKAKKVSATATAHSIQTGIEQFYTEYSVLPSAANTTDTALDTSLVRTLTGDDKTLNPRGYIFLSLPKTRSKKSGIPPAKYQVFDPWGNGYQVIIDVHSSGTITVTRGGISETIKGRKAVVFSLGADEIAGTADGVLTW